MTALTVDQITSAIISGSMTNDDLNRVIMAVTFARNQMARQAKRSISRGDTVKWNSPKMGRTMQGKVIDIKVKYIHVDTPQGTWRVPAHHLTLV